MGFVQSLHGCLSGRPFHCFLGQGPSCHPEFASVTLACIIVEALKDAEWKAIAKIHDQPLLDGIPFIGDQVLCSTYRLASSLLCRWGWPWTLSLLPVPPKGWDYSLVTPCRSAAFNHTIEFFTCSKADRCSCPWDRLRDQAPSLTSRDYKLEKGVWISLL